MLGALDTVIIVLIISAGMLAFVVLYNLNNVNITERQRELGNLKVLGFYDTEVSACMCTGRMLSLLSSACWQELYSESFCTGILSVLWKWMRLCSEEILILSVSCTADC